jgi:hypothetical protein
VTGLVSYFHARFYPLAIIDLQMGGSTSYALTSANDETQSAENRPAIKYIVFNCYEAATVMAPVRIRRGDWMRGQRQLCADLG